LATATALPATTPRLRVALLGSRGIPARYGGYETLMQEIAPRLVARGFDVTVFCRRHAIPAGVREYHGVHLAVLPTIRTKHLDTPVHTALSALATWGRGFDAALVVNAANAIFVPLIRLGGTPVALHVDGIEKRRAKWGPLGRAVYALSERLAGTVANVVVSDAEVIEAHYRERYGVASTLITYGVCDQPPATTSTLDQLGLRSRGYVLYVSRFEPENNPHHVVAAWRQVAANIPLVMVGGAPYADSFIRSFTEGADPRVLFAGPIYGEGYRQLQAHALAYIHATEVGGTHPALVEAMGLGGCPIVHDVPENREVAGDCAHFVDIHDHQQLAAAVDLVVADPVAARQLGERAQARATARYSWDAVSDAYARLFLTLAGRDDARMP
jgi:glycosyltransferase involved in cell wall biosynthesis